MRLCRFLERAALLGRQILQCGVGQEESPILLQPSPRDNILSSFRSSGKETLGRGKGDIPYPHAPPVEISLILPERVNSIETANGIVILCFGIVTGEESDIIACHYFLVPSRLHSAHDRKKNSDSSMENLQDQSLPYKKQKSQLECLRLELQKISLDITKVQRLTENILRCETYSSYDVEQYLFPHQALGHFEAYPLVLFMANEVMLKQQTCAYIQHWDFFLLLQLLWLPVMRLATFCSGSTE